MTAALYPALLLFSSVLFVAVCAVYARQTSCSWHNPLSLFLIVHGLLFVIRPWVSWLYGYEVIYDAFHFYPTAWTKNLSLVVANVGLLAFSIPAIWVARTPLTFEQREGHRRAEYLPSFIILLSVLVPLFGYSVWINWQYRMFDKAFNDVDVATGTITSNVYSGYLMGMIGASVFLLPLIAWMFKFRPAAIVATGALFLFLIAGGTRAPAICALFSIIGFYLYDTKRKWLNWRIVAAAVATFVLFNTVGADRGASLRRYFTGEYQEQTYEASKTAPLEGMDFGNLEFLEYLVQTVPYKTGTFEYFVDQLQIFTEPVPRSLWKDKPIGQPIRFFNLMDYGSPIGMTRSLPGEGWTQLGIVGVILWCALWGFCLARFYEWFARGPKDPFRMTIYYGILSLMVVCYRDGQILSIMRYGLFIAGPLLLWVLAYYLLPRGRRLAAFRVRQGPAPDERDADREARDTPRSQRHVARVVPRAWRSSQSAL